MKGGFVPGSLLLSGPILPRGFEMEPSYIELTDTAILGALTLVLFVCVIISEKGILSDG